MYRYTKGVIMKTWKRKYLNTGFIIGLKKLQGFRWFYKEIKSKTKRH